MWRCCYLVGLICGLLNHFYLGHCSPAPGIMEVQKLVASDGASEDYFGASVALHGNLLVTGAWKTGGWTGTSMLS